jgi:hypothetical protein
MPGQFTTGPNGKLTPKPGTTLNGKTAPISSADQSATGNNQIPLTSNPHHGGHTSIQETRSTQETKKGRGAAQILKFPINREDMYPAYMVFHPYKIDTGMLDSLLGEVFNSPLVADFVEGKTSESVNDTVGGYDAVGTSTVSDPAKKQQIEVEQAQKEANRDQINKEIEDNREQMGSKLTDLRAYRDLDNPAIQLFFPPQLQYNDAVNYNSANLGGAGMAATAALNSGQSILGALGAGLTEGIESIFNLATGSVSAEAAKVGAARLAKKVPGGTANAVSSMLQTGMNPGTRLLFDQPAMRSFAFSFKLIPTSPQEAITIKEIVKNFRFQMYPREIDVSPGIPIGYEFPNIYRIEFGFTGASNLEIPKIQYCYLKDVQAAYNSTSGGVFFEDGHPTEIDLNLTFLEYRALSKRDIEAGF